jgi:hypothetical protein
VIVSRLGGPFAVAVAITVAALVAPRAEGSALKLRATLVAVPGAGPLTIDLNRWSSDAERGPLLTALSAPVPAPARQSGPPAGAAAARGGRAARGGARGGAAPPPPSPLARLTTAIKAAPTVGYLWSGGITGYSIKYAWRAAAEGGERIVLVTDRRLGANSPGWPVPEGGPADAEFTVLELHLATNGAGEARSSLHSNIVVDESARTLALATYASAPTFLKVTR